MPDVNDIATVIATTVSLVALLYTLLATRRNERDLERLKAEFTELQAERDARRDYEYEARKRLYTEFEPLFFQFFEVARAARGQIYGLASAARRGNLEPGVSWLAQPDSYFTLSVTYSLFAPLALGRVLQNRLTFVDLSLDERVKSQYDAIRRLIRVFSHDYGLATSAPAIPYDPNHPDAAQLCQEQPAAYRRQGIFAGYRDMVIESFLVSSPEQPQRLLSFGEFMRMREEHPAEFEQRFGRAVALFQGFHPRTCPVLWRILLAQCALYRWIRDSVDSPRRMLTAESLQEPLTERTAFDWRPPGDATPDAAALNEPFHAVAAYFTQGFRD